MKFPSTVALSAALAFFAPHDVRAAQCLEFASVSTNAKLQVNITNLPTPFVVAGLKYSYDLTNLTGNSATVVQGSASYPVGRLLEFILSVDNGVGFSTVAQISVVGSTTAALTNSLAGTVLLTASRNILPNGWPASDFPPLSNWDFATSLSVTTPGGIPNVGSVTSITACTAPGSTPSIKPGGVVSASAFGQFTSVAPGSWIEIYGSNLAGGTRGWTNADFSRVNAPTSLDGVKVTIGGQAAFVDYISPGQVNAQVPSNVGIGSQTVVVSNGSLSSSAAPITVNTVQPGLLAPDPFTVGGKQYAAALFADGATYVLPPGAIPGAPARRARAGDIITLYGIGFGPVSTDIPAGQIVQTTNQLAAPVHIFFGGAETTVTYAGLVPRTVGLYQFNVVVPSIPSNDLAPLTFSIGGTSGTPTLYLAIE